MTDNIDIADLAEQIAHIASTTKDPDTARRLMALVGRLLTAAGLPDEGGGEMPPADWLMEPMCCPGYA